MFQFKGLVCQIRSYYVVIFIRSVLVRDRTFFMTFLFPEDVSGGCSVSQAGLVFENEPIFLAVGRGGKSYR
jgi:hypothetical protein